MKTKQKTMVTLMFYIGDYIRKSMTKARKNVLRNKGFNNQSARLGAYFKGEISPISSNL